MINKIRRMGYIKSVVKTYELAAEEASAAVVASLEEVGPGMALGRLVPWEGASDHPDPFEVASVLVDPSSRAAQDLQDP